MFPNKIVLALSFLLFSIAVNFTNPVYAGGGTIKRHYTMPKTSDLFNDRITVRFAEGIAENIEKGKLDPTIAALFTKWGVVKHYKRFPHTEKPKVAFIDGERTVNLNPIYVLQVNPMTNLEGMINDFLSLETVEYAEPNFWAKISYVPNDQYVNSGAMYFLNNIQAYQAWDITTGNSNLIIATVDSGTDIDHPDLVNNFYRNPNEIPNDNIDNDANGYVDDVIGWDFAGPDYLNIAPDNNAGVTGSNNSHGVHTGGTSCASGGNNQGVAGIAYGCRAMPVKASADNDNRASGSGYILYGYEGIVYAAANGAKVINCSFGSAQAGSSESDGIRFATVNKGAMVVAAAGNDNVSTRNYPSSYPYVFSVAASNFNDVKAGFSNFGETVDISAPGVGILSTTFNNAYENMSGTSMASPVTAGVVALLRSHYPWMTPAQVEAQLKATSDNIYNIAGNSRYRDQLGAGRINAFRALTETFPVFEYKVTNAATRIGSPLVSNGDTLLVSGIVSNKLFRSTGQAKMKVRLTSNFVSIVGSDSVAVGSLGYGQQLSQPIPFRFKIIGAIPENHNPQMVAIFTDSAGFTRTVAIDLKLNTSTINIVKPLISTTITSNSRFGYGEFNDTTKGLGFRFKDVNALFEAGILVGTSADSLSDNLRSTVNGTSYNYNNDFVPVAPIRRLLDTINQIRYEATFSDRNAVKPLGIEIIQTAYDTKYDADSNFIIMKYAITNKGNRNLNHLSFGFFTDFDISANGNNDRMIYRASQKLGMMFNTTSPQKYFAVYSPNQTLPVHPYGIFNSGPNINNLVGINDGFTKAEKWLAITTENASAGASAGEDISMVMNYGPFDLPINSTLVIPIIIAADWSLANLQRTAANANNSYNLVTTTKEKLNDLAVYLFPNPTNGLVNLSLKSELPATIHLSDTRGRTFANFSTAEQNLSLDLTGYKPGLYLVYVTQGAKTGVYKVLVK